MTRAEDRPPPPPRPTREQLEAARDQLLPDLVAPGLDVLLCGINPSLWAAATNAHFQRDDLARVFGELRRAVTGD